MKAYKGWELIKAIENGEIKRGTKLYVFFNNEKVDMNARMKFYTIVGVYRMLHLWREEKGKEDEEVRAIHTEDLTCKSFFIIEAQQDIDIQAIEGFYIDLDFNDIEKWEDELKITSKIDELIKAVKQLDNKINKE